jgi:hypothetical protein
MAMVFDEVEGVIEGEPATPANGAARAPEARLAGAGAVDLERLMHELERDLRLKARLHAD